jgi:hypothetical protein
MSLTSYPQFFAHGPVTLELADALVAQVIEAKFQESVKLGKVLPIPKYVMINGDRYRVSHHLGIATWPHP